MSNNLSGLSTKITELVDRCREAWWLHGLVCCLRIQGSGFAPWPGTLCCVLGQGTLLSQCLSPPRSINGYWWIVGETKEMRGSDPQSLVSRPGEVEILLAVSCYRNRDTEAPAATSPSGSKVSLSFKPNNVSWCKSCRCSFRSVFQMHRNEEQPKFQCEIITIANANTHCPHWLTLRGLERIRK